MNAESTDDAYYAEVDVDVDHDDKQHTLRIDGTSMMARADDDHGERPVYSKVNKQRDRVGSTAMQMEETTAAFGFDGPAKNGDDEDADV